MGGLSMLVGRLSGLKVTDLSSLVSIFTPWILC